MKVLVLGGRGFIGRNIVQALRKQGVDVLVGSRFADAAKQDQRQVAMQDMLQPRDWFALLSEVDVVVNSVGILRQRRGETYQAIHQLAPAALAQASALKGKRLIHISALGLSLTAKSRFIKSKYLGEQGILASGAEAAIVRPSLLDGDSGFGAKWFRMVAQWPVHFVMRAPKGLVAPMKVTDLGDAVAALVMLPQQELRAMYELGTTNLTIAQYLQVLRTEYTPTRALQVTLPIWLVRLVSHIFDVLKFSPLSFGHVELMQGRNVPSENQLRLILKREPATIGASSQVFVDKGCIAQT